jgi:hypothetical protein
MTKKKKTDPKAAKLQAENKKLKKSTADLTKALKTAIKYGLAERAFTESDEKKIKKGLGPYAAWGAGWHCAPYLCNSGGSVFPANTVQEIAFCNSVTCPPTTTLPDGSSWQIWGTCHPC